MMARSSSAPSTLAGRCSVDVSEGLFLQVEPPQDRALPGLRQVGDQRIDHHVADATEGPTRVPSLAQTSVAGERGFYVADNDHPSGFSARQTGSKASITRLSGPRGTGAYAEVDVGPRTSSSSKNTRHPLVVVLARCAPAGTSPAAPGPLHARCRSR